MPRSIPPVRHPAVPAPKWLIARQGHVTTTRVRAAMITIKVSAPLPCCPTCGRPPIPALITDEVVQRPADGERRARAEVARIVRCPCGTAWEPATS